MPSPFVRVWADGSAMPRGTIQVYRRPGDAQGRLLVRVGQELRAWLQKYRPNAVRITA